MRRPSCEIRQRQHAARAQLGVGHARVAAPRAPPTGAAIATTASPNARISAATCSGLAGS